MTDYMTPEIIASYHAADLYENASGFASGSEDDCPGNSDCTPY